MMKCTMGKTHRWTWEKDVTNVSVVANERGVRKTMSRHGVYVCACGAKKQGMARTGL